MVAIFSTISSAGTGASRPPAQLFPGSGRPGAAPGLTTRPTFFAIKVLSLISGNNCGSLLSHLNDYFGVI